MKFGVAGIKIWINRKGRLPFHYNKFKFVYDIDNLMEQLQEDNLEEQEGK